MSRIVWDQVGQRTYETGVDHGVLFPTDNQGQYGVGVPWNGLSAVNNSPEGADANDIYADNIKYLSLIGAENLKLSIEAYTYPKEFAACDGTANPAAGMSIGQQGRKVFGFVYRTNVGNDMAGQEAGYKLHIVYGCKASPSQKNYQTVGENPEALSFSWDISTTPVPVTGYRPTAEVCIDSTEVDADKLAEVEAQLFGSENEDPTLLMPDEIIAILTAA